MNVCENSKLPSSFPVVLNKIHREAGIAIESTCFFVRLTSFLLSWLLLTLSHSGLTEPHQFGLMPNIQAEFLLQIQF